MNEISNRQKLILDFIKKSVKAKGYPPSVREIGEAVGLLSSSTVHGHLARLEKKGYIRRDPTKPRAIEILSDELVDEPLSRNMVQVPLIGKVTAGEPITAIENIEDYFPLPSHMANDGKVFMLTVQGDSMIDAGILNGDYVIVRQQPVASNGEIIVAMTDEGDATVKRFYKEKNYIRLQPENPTLDPILLPNVTILGKVIGVFRHIH